MKIPEHLQRQSGQAGFSLVELIVVVVIMGILAAYVTYNLSTGRTKLKTFVFNTKTHFHKAKFEAIKRGRNVYIDFDFNPPVGTIDNGYTVWADENNNEVYDGADTIIDTIVFQSGGPAIYVVGRPEEPSNSNKGPGSKTIDNGVSATNERLIIRPNGRCKNNGSVYFYLPKSATNNTLAAGPWVIVVNSMGRIRVDEWRTSGWVDDI